MMVVVVVVIIKMKVIVVVVVDNDGGDGGSGHNDVLPSYIVKESLTPVKVIPTIRVMTRKACDLNFFLF